MSADDIARDLLRRSDANLTSALLRACSLLESARMRVEDHLPDSAMGPDALALLWSDLHPHRAAPDVTKEGEGDG